MPSIDKMRETVSASSIKIWSKCPKKYYYIYVAERVPIVVSDTLRFGKIIHEALARWHTVGVDKTFSYLEGLSDQIAGVDAAKLIAMFTYYKPSFEGYKVVAAEQEFSSAIVNPNTGRALKGIRLRGFIDVLLEDDLGQHVVAEHKHTSQQIIGFGPYWSGLAIDDQLAIYSLVYGAKCMIYNVLRKPTLRISKADMGSDDAETLTRYLERCLAEISSNPEEWYQVRKIWKSDNEIRDAAHSLYQRVYMMREHVKRGWYPRFPHSCRDVFGACEYLDVCTGRASIDDAASFTDRVTDR